MSEGSRVGDGTLEQLADAVRCSSSAQFGGCAAFQGCEDVAVRRELAVKNTLAKKEGKWLGRSELSKGKSDMQCDTRVKLIMMLVYFRPGFAVLQVPGRS